jgi:hypothetical protein
MHKPEHLPGEGDRRAARPARASPHARQAGSRRRGDGDADRPPRAVDLRLVRHRQADRGRQGAIPILGEPWADTGTSTGRLMLAVLGGLADVERDLIRTRTPKAEAAPQL